MKVLLLSEINSSHTMKWASGLSRAGLEIWVFGLTKPRPEVLSFYLKYPSIKLCFSDHHSRYKWMHYYHHYLYLRALVSEIAPDIVHAHYAISYGLIGTLLFFEPYVTSVWGNDVFRFPKEFWGFRVCLQWVLSRSRVIFSTSHIMKRETQRYTNRPIEVIPFGVDVDVFKPALGSQSDGLVIGIIKSLEKKYGIAYLIRAFSLLKTRHPDVLLKLVIAGAGSEESMLKQLVMELELGDSVEFLGMLPPDRVLSCHQSIDIFVCPSIEDSESFGVSVVEASACGKPVVVSNVGGLVEVVVPDKTGLVVPPQDVEALCSALSRLVLDAGLRKSFGYAGRQRVESLFDLRHNVLQTVSQYQKLLS
jgi:glycosyltransferase involved in cell wall biosynthesis